MFSALDLFTRGRSEWQLSPTQPTFVRKTGPDAAFLASIVAFLVAAGLTIWAFTALSRVARAQRDPGAV